jgi:type I restriction enzyme S subunit
MLPEGWSVKRLDEIATVTSGGTPSRSELSYWENGDIPWIRTTEVQNCHLYYEDVIEFITEKGMRNSSAKLLPINTILIAMIGQGKTRGQLALLKIEASTNQNAAAIIFNDNSYPEFFFHYLLTQYENIRSHSNSAGQSNLSGALVKEIKVPFPPLPEQKKIAQILSTWDKAITATEQLIANSQQQKKALMQQLLTGKKRLLDDNGVRFSGEWEHSTLRNILTVSKGQQLNKDTLDSTGLYPVINGGITPSGYTDQKNRSANTITISEGGNSCGYVAFQTKDFWCGGHCYSATNLKLNLKFTYHCLKFNENRIMKLRVGSGLPNIQKKDIDGLVIKYPNCHIEQQKIASVLSLADREIEALQNKLTALKQEKKALMQQLLTGKRRVNTKG